MLRYYLLVLISVVVPKISGQTLESIAQMLDSVPTASGNVQYKVYLPSSPEPVEHDVDVHATRVPSDTLLPVSYLLDWTLTTPSGESHAFTAYFDGNFYRYHNNRLTEYHRDTDISSLGRGSSPGVQITAQFAELTPVVLARRLRAMASDSSYIYEIKPQPQSQRIVVDGVRRVSGYDGMEYEYVFDASTGLPLAFDLVYNPASISEQTVTATFDWDKNARPLVINEDELIKRYPDIFARYRTSNYRIENLMGEPVPTFTSPTPTRERYHHVRGDDFRSPTVLVYLDTSVGDAANTVSDIRRGVDTLPVSADVIYLFADKDIDAIETVTGPMREGEHVLMNAGAAARDMGVTVTPTIIFCSRDRGIITDVQIGYNKNLPIIVNQKITSLNDY